MRELDPESRIRVGRDDRERCVDALQDHYAAGRLGEHELADRVGTALTATTRSDLRALLADLPGAPGADRSDGRPRLRTVLVALAGTVVVGVLGIGAVGLASGAAPANPGEDPTSTCLATGELIGPGEYCPVVSSAQQQIFADADAADRAAHQLLEMADRNPDAGLTGLLERAWASAGRAQDAAANSQQLVLVADGEPSDKVLATAAKAAEKAAADTQRTLDQALERLDG